MVKTKCVHCGFLVHEFTTECPSCGKPIANKYAPTKVSDLNWKNSASKNKKTNPVIAIAIIVAIFTVAGLIYFALLK